MVLGAVDPNFNAAPDTFDMYSYKATYWLINGKAYPNTAVHYRSGRTSGSLLRYVNAGIRQLVDGPAGHARAGRRSRRPPAEQSVRRERRDDPGRATEDAIATVPAGATPSTHGFPLYNRQLHVTNGDQTATSPVPATGGGMLTFIHP